MLTIRQIQMTALEASARCAFENRMLDHVNKFFPEECARFDAAALKTLVCGAIDRAILYGIVSERDVCSFLNVTFTFGRFYDEDYNWAKAILSDASIRSGEFRMTMLGREAVRRAAFGEGRGLAAN